jgi:hypothetical protein
VVEWKLKGRIRKNPTDEVSRPGPPGFFLFITDLQQQQLKSPFGLLFRLQSTMTALAIGFPRRRTSLPLALVPGLLDALKSYRWFQIRNF